MIFMITVMNVALIETFIVGMLLGFAGFGCQNKDIFHDVVAPAYGILNTDKQAIFNPSVKPSGVISSVLTLSYNGCRL